MRGLEQMSWKVVVRAQDFREGVFLMMTRSKLCPWECAEVEGERHLRCDHCGTLQPRSRLDQPHGPLAAQDEGVERKAQTKRQQPSVTMGDRVSGWMVRSLRRFHILERKRE